MRNKLLGFVFAAMSFCPFISFGQTPLEFNNQMSTIADSLYKKGVHWGNKFSEIAKTSKKFDELSTARRGLEQYIYDQTALLKDMKDISGSFDFRQAMIGYLYYEKQLVDSVITPFEALSPATSDAAFNEKVQKLLSAAADEKNYLDKVHVAEYAYAKMNNFTVPGQN